MKIQPSTKHRQIPRPTKFAPRPKRRDIAITSSISFDDCKLSSVAVADIVYSGSYRPLDETHVGELQQSFARIGLVTPISLAVGNILLAGQHRLEAARRLGWPHIDAITFPAKEKVNRLVAIAENLHRLELSALDRADLQAEWLRIFQEEARQVAELAGGGQPHDRSVSKASRQTGVSPRQLRRSETIAHMAPEAKAKARELGLDQKQDALLRIAEGKNAEEQLRIAVELAKRKKKRPISTGKEIADRTPPVDNTLLPAVNWSTSRDETVRDDIGIPDFLKRGDPEEHFNKLVAAWNAAPRLRAAWVDAPPDARSRFASDVLRVADSKQSEVNNAD